MESVFLKTWNDPGLEKPKYLTQYDSLKINQMGPLLLGATIGHAAATKGMKAEDLSARLHTILQQPSDREHHGSLFKAEIVEGLIGILKECGVKVTNNVWERLAAAAIYPYKVYKGGVVNHSEFFDVVMKNLGLVLTKNK